MYRAHQRTNCQQCNVASPTNSLLEASFGGYTVLCSGKSSGLELCSPAWKPSTLFCTFASPKIIIQPLGLRKRHHQQQKKKPGTSSSLPSAPLLARKLLYFLPVRPRWDMFGWKVDDPDQAYFRLLWEWVNIYSSWDMIYSMLSQY